jgi:hypothetical protein
VIEIPCYFWEIIMTVSNKLTTTLLAVAALACVESSARANIVSVATLSGSAVGLTVQTPLPGTTITGNRGGSVHLHSSTRLLSGASAGFMPLREAAG